MLNLYPNITKYFLPFSPVKVTVFPVLVASSIYFVISLAGTPVASDVNSSSLLYLDGSYNDYVLDSSIWTTDTHQPT